MTLKTKNIHESLDFLDVGLLKNWGIQVLSSDPATSYARIYQRSTDGVIRSYNIFTSAWETIGAGTIGADSITNAMLNNMAANTVKANITGSSDNPTDVTKSSFITWLALVAGDVGLGNVTNVAQLPLSYLDTDGTLAANSDTKVPSQKAVNTKINALLAASDAFVFKGTIDCSANPNYPAANAGETYKVSVAGKIGGASGVNVQVGDTAYCTVDGSASGNQATVGANWTIIQVNIDGAVVGPSSATDGDIALYNGTSGVLIKVLSGSNDDFAQRKAGAWVNRTVAQVKTDLGITGTETRRFTATIGDGSTADLVITHSLAGQKDVIAHFRDASTDEPTDVFWVPTSTTAITAYFPTAPATNSLKVVVVG